MSGAWPKTEERLGVVKGVINLTPGTFTAPFVCPGPGALYVRSHQHVMT